MTLTTMVNAQKIMPVDNFELDRYLGLWYEIARYTLWFERDMENVTAEYIKEKDYLRVINKGVKGGKEKTAKGKATYDKNSTIGKLRVSFFWPFKSDYLVIKLDDNYQWAIVSDYKKSSLWILSRSYNMEKELYNSLIEWLKLMGFDETKIEKTIHKYKS